MFKEATTTLDSLIPLQVHYNILEKQLIAKFGSYDHACKEVKTLRKKFVDELEFINSLFQLIYSEKILQFLRPLQDVKDLPDLIKYVSELNSNEAPLLISENELLEIIRMQDIYKQEVELLIQNEKIDLFKELDKKLSFTIKEIRESLPLNQRTFTKWLQYFFKDKYDKVRKITLTQYIEIYEKLLLKEDEVKFNFSFDAQAYFERIEGGLVFSKKKLAQITTSDYKQLKIKMEKMEVNLPGVNRLPYTLAQKIIEEMG